MHQPSARYSGYSILCATAQVADQLGDRLAQGLAGRGQSHSSSTADSTAPSDFNRPHHCRACPRLRASSSGCSRRQPRQLFSRVEEVEDDRFDVGKFSRVVPRPAPPSDRPIQRSAPGPSRRRRRGAVGANASRDSPERWARIGPGSSSGQATRGRGLQTIPTGSAPSAAPPCSPWRRMPGGVEFDVGRRSFPGSPCAKASPTGRGFAGPDPSASRRRPRRSARRSPPRRRRRPSRRAPSGPSRSRRRPCRRRPAPGSSRGRQPGRGHRRGTAPCARQR